MAIHQPCVYRWLTKLRSQKEGVTFSDCFAGEKCSGFFTSRLALLTGYILSGMWVIFINNWYIIIDIYSFLRLQSVFYHPFYTYRQHLIIDYIPIYIYMFIISIYLHSPCILVWGLGTLDNYTLLSVVGVLNVGVGLSRICYLLSLLINIGRYRTIYSFCPLSFSTAHPHYCFNFVVVLPILYGAPLCFTFFVSHFSLAFFLFSFFFVSFCEAFQSWPLPFFTLFTI